MPDVRRRYWTIYLAMGYINAKEQYGQTVSRTLQEMLYKEQHQELKKLLIQVLQEKVSLSSQEAAQYVETFEDDHAKIWYGA